MHQQDAKSFIGKCLGPPGDRPTVQQLLEDRFFCRKPAAPRPQSEDGGAGGRDASLCGDDYRGAGSSGAG